MIALRLQQTLNKRIQMLQNLLLIYSYSQLVTVNVCQYRKDNEKLYQKQITLIETYKNIFKVDQNFRKFFYSLSCRTFTQLNSKFKQKMSKNTINKIHSVYIQFLSFFKSANQYEIVRFLNKVQIDIVSENQLFSLLITTLIKYLKAKTDVVILKLREKCSKESIDFYQQKSIKILQKEQQQHQNNFFPRKKNNNCLRDRTHTPGLAIRKYHSQDAHQNRLLSERRRSRQFSGGKKNNFLTQCKSMQVKTTNHIRWNIGIRKFQEIYFCQWQKYYSLLNPLSEQLQEIKLKYRKIQMKQRKEWIYEHFNNIYQESLSRNQNILRTIQKGNHSKTSIKSNQNFV